MSNNFLDQLKRKQAAAKASPLAKPISEMTDEEMDREEERLRAEIRSLREVEIAQSREEAVSLASPPKRFLPNKRSRRPYWK